MKVHQPAIQEKGKPMHLALDLLKSYVVPGLILRDLDDATIARYAEAMEAGQEFPAVVVGNVKNEPAKKILVDGMHRLAAAESIKRASLDVIEKTYATHADLVADMLIANTHHGKPVAEKDRDARIKMLYAEPYKMSQTAIAKAVGLTQASVSRILKGEQEADGKADTKEKKGKAIFQASALLKASEKIVRSLKNRTVSKDLQALCWPDDDASTKEKQKAIANMDTIQKAMEALDNFLGELKADQKK